MERYLCDICKNQLKIRYGDYLFKFNTECSNGHINKNVLLKDCYPTDENIYKCQEHQKYNLLYCFTCQKELCLYCQNSHKDHKTGYLKAIQEDALLDSPCYTIIK